MFMMRDFKRFSKKIVVHTALAAQIALAILPAFARAAGHVTSPGDTVKLGSAGSLAPEERAEKERLLKFLKEGVGLRAEDGRPILVHEIKERAYAKEIFLACAKYDPGYVLTWKSDLEEEPYYGDVMKIALSREGLLKAAETSGGAVAENMHAFYKEPWAEDVMRAAIKSQPVNVVPKLGRLEGMSYFESLSKYAAQEAPRMCLLYFNVFEKAPFAENLLEIASRGAPAFFLKNFNEKPEAIAEESFETMRKIARQSVVEKISAGSELDALMVVLGINDRHELPDAQRYADIEGYPSLALYNLIVCGREEIFTSSFREISARLLAALKQEGKTILDLSRDPRAQKGLPVFLEAAASYGKIGDVLDSLPDSAQRKSFLQSAFSSVESLFKEMEAPPYANFSKEKILRLSIALTDVLLCIEDKEIKDAFSELFLQQYQTTKNADYKRVLGYGISYALQEGVIENTPSFAKTEDFVSAYRIDPLDKLDEAALFDKGVQYQRMVFYGDEDGKASYAHFAKTFSKARGWSVERKDGFSVFKKAASGRTIAIVCNHPDAAEAGHEAALKYLSGKNVQVFAHRGHSYNAPGSFPVLEEYKESVRLVYWGSCGGYQNISKTNDLLSHEAPHIISTKGIGTMFVNDFLLASLCDAMLEKGRVDWRPVWQGVAHSVKDSRFGDYVPPDRNVAAQIIASLRREFGHTNLQGAPARGYASINPRNAAVTP